MDADGNKSGGRQKGTPNKATAEVRALALEYGPDAFKKLAELAGVAKGEDGGSLPGASSEAARVSAIGMLLDRGFGKALPGRAIEIELPDTSSPEGIPKAISAVLRSAAAGDLTPSEASDFCGLIDSLRQAYDSESMEKRLAALEAHRGR